MPARRRVAERQMELLVEFAESNRDLALGRFPAGPQATRMTRQLWESVAGRLNVVAEGTTKTPDQWRRYWIELKAKTKTKAADSRRNASATGGGPNKFVPLNAIEERVLAIIGPVAVEGLPGVRLPIDTSVDENEAIPIMSGMEVTTSSAPIISTFTPNLKSPSPVPNPMSPEPDMYEEWLEEEIPQRRLQSIQPPSIPTATTSIPIPTQPDEHRVGSREERPAQCSTSTDIRSRLRRPINRDERVPRWAYDIEMRRIAAEERNAAAMEAIVGLIKEIRDDIHSYLNLSK